MNGTIALYVLGVGLVSIGIGAVVASLVAREEPVDASYFGMRGLRRRAVLAESPLFAAIEPVLRFLARFLRAIPLGGLRARVQTSLTHAGDWLGVTVDELLALSLLSSFAASGAGVALLAWAELPRVLSVFFAGLGLVMPYVALTGVAAERQRNVERAMPPAIDLVSLCMSAGLHFAGAIQEAVSKGLRRDEPLSEELRFLLHQLDLGQTRDRALRTFAERVPTEAVQLFTSAVRQAEQKGTPLAEVLETQAESLRTRRSVAGEEAAAKAAVRMLFPLMLILLSILLVLMGPFALRNMAAGLF